MADSERAEAGDVTRCELCDELLDDSEAWRRGLDGAGAHDRCLRAYGIKIRPRPVETQEERNG